MRRLCTRLKASTTTKQLYLLALVNIYRRVKIDFKHAIKIFLKLHPQKLEVSNLVCDEI